MNTTKGEWKGFLFASSFMTHRTLFAFTTIDQCQRAKWIFGYVQKGHFLQYYYVYHKLIKEGNADPALKTDF